MKHRAIALFFGLVVVGIASTVLGQGTAFMYQGRLNTNGIGASGPYDFRFQLYDALSGGNAVTPPETNVSVTVASGLFSTTLDFGAVFKGTNYWLDIGVRTNGNATNTFTILTPRQPLLPVPYAIFANTASNLLGTLLASQLSGALPSAQITGNYFGPVNFTNGANSFLGTFFGSGGSLSNLNGSQITSGTVADARLSTNVALLNGTQVFTGVSSFTNRANAFTGNFFGNGVVGWFQVTGTSTQAVANAGYICLNSNRTTVTLPPAAGLVPGDVVRISGAGSGGWVVAGNVKQMVQGNFSSYDNSRWVQASIPTAGFWRCMASTPSGSPIYAAGSIGSGGLFVSYDFGATWSQIGLTGTSWAGLACSADGQTIYVAPSPGGGTGKIQCSFDGGIHWTNIFGAGNWTAIACSSDGTKVIAATTNGANSAVYVSSDAGTSSNKVAGLATSAKWTAVTSSSDGSRQAAAVNNGVVYYGINGSWAAGNRSANWVSMVSSSDGLRLAACTLTNTGGSVFTSSDGGATWGLTPAPNAFWTCVAGSSDGSRLLAGINGNVIYSSVNFGTTWTPLNTTNASWGCLISSADGSKLAGGANVTGGQIYYSTVSPQYVISTNTSSLVGGGQGSAIELQYIGDSQGTNQFMPVSSTGQLWVN